MFKQNTSRIVRWLAALTALASLTACSNKPSASDIEHGLTEVYNCPALEIRDVKKLDGAPGAQGTYEVSFSYVVAVKGSESDAVKTLTEEVYLEREIEVLQKGYGSQSDAGRAYRRQLGERQLALFSCLGNESGTITSTLVSLANETIGKGSGTASFQIGARITRVGRMTKSERGWHFASIAPNFNDIQDVDSSPTAFALPASKVPGAAPPVNPQIIAAGERRLTGTIRAGQTDSCLEVVADGKERCYDLPGQATQAQRIFSICGDGDTCAITGQFDDKAESLGAFSTVEKVSR